jgi:flagellin-like protein
MMRLLRNRKAVSPVISTVLMILVVMVGMSLLFAFFVSYARDFQTGSGSAVLESMTIEDVWFKGSNEAQIWVYNVGKVNFTIASVYVNDQNANFYNPDNPENPPIAPGQHSRIIVPSAFSGCTIKIVTARGSAFEGSYS